MLFWIFVIGLIICLVLMSLPCKEKKEYQNLENENEKARKLWYNTHCNSYNYKEIRDYYYKTETELDLFKETSKYKKILFRDSLNNFLTAGAGICAVFVTAMLIVLISIYGTAGGNREKLEAEYEVLSWEVENDIYTDGDDDVIGKKETYNQVREWNSRLAKNQYYEKNFWIGIFVPNIYSDLKPIELK